MGKTRASKIAWAFPWVVAAVSAGAALAAAQEEWLSLGSKYWAPTVTSKSGIGTDHATAEAKVTRKEIEGWCANWTPEDKNCVRQTLASDDAKKTYRASADCTRGRITPVDGMTYTLAGTWDNSDIGAGQTRWRDASGKIVGRDNASNGLGISQQWEVLCPGPRGWGGNHGATNCPEQSPEDARRPVRAGGGRRSAVWPRVGAWAGEQDTRSTRRQRSRDRLRGESR
jgi:hypothetical protein